MRITGGDYRGRILQSPVDDAIRPTADKTRLAIFNMIDSRGGVVDVTVIDLCCGTGALGLDALSRGAAQAIFMDTARASLDLARTNARLLKCEDRCAFLQVDGTNLPVRGSHAPANLVFLDPPYHHNFVPQMIGSLVAGDWLAAGAVVVAETERKTGPLILDGFEELVQKNYGETRVTLFRFQPSI